MFILLQHTLQKLMKFVQKYFTDEIAQTFPHALSENA